MSTKDKSLAENRLTIKELIKYYVKRYSWYLTPAMNQTHQSPSRFKVSMPDSGLQLEGS